MGVEPDGAWSGAKATEPGALVFSEAAGFDLDGLDGVVEGGAGLEMIDELLVAEGFAGLDTEKA